MAFFGSDGLENTNKQLTKQLASKNAELAFMKNERDTRARELSEAKRTIEVLEARNEGFELERERWESLKDGKSGPVESSSKDLERIRKLEGEVKALRVENQQLVSIKPSVPSAASRRRSTSLNSGDRVRELEAEVAALRVAQGGSDEIDTLKSQLATAKRDQLKAENVQVALERSSKKELEALKCRLDDVTDELEFYRNTPGSDGEVQKVKKEAEVERVNLMARIDKLEQDVKARTAEVQRSEERLEQIEAELEQARQNQHHSDNPITSDLEAKLATLEAELKAARAKSLPSSKSDGNLMQSSKSDRNLEKEIRSKSRRIEDLEDENVELKEEIFNLKRTIPIPASPTNTPRTLQDENDHQAEHKAAVERLETELADMRIQLEEQELEVQRMEGVLQKRQAQTETLQNQRDSFAEEIQQLKNTLSETREAVRQAESALADAQLRIAGLQGDLESARAALTPAQSTAERAEAALAERVSELQDITKQRDAFAQALSTRTHTNEEFDAARDALQAAEDKIQSMNPELVQLRQACDDLRGKEKEALARYSQAEQNLQLAINDLDGLREKAKQADLLAAEQAGSSQNIQSLTEQLNEHRAEVHGLQLRLEDKQAELAKLTASTDEMQQRLEEAIADRHRLEDRLEELQSTVADRSTESEARQRDEELFQLREEAAAHQSQLKSEIERHEAEMEAFEFAKLKDAEDSGARIAQLSETIAEHQSRIEVLQVKVQESERRVEEAQSALEVARHAMATKDAQIKSFSRSSSSPDVRRYMVKIDALRLERDEARQSLSFVQNEQRFALEAAKADRESAVEALRQAQSDLKAKSDRLDGLKAEHDETVERLSVLTGRLQSTEGSYASASAEQHDLKDRVAQLELDMARVGKERDELSRQVESLEEEPKHHDQRLLDVLNKSFVQEREHGKLIREHATLKAHCAELESRIDCLQSIIDGKKTSSIGQQGEGATTDVHLRDELEDLREQLEESRRRVGRREDTIRSLHTENKKIKMNETLARAAIEDVTSNATLLKEDYADLEQTWRDTVITLAVYHTGRRAMSRQLHATRATLGETRGALSRLQVEVASLQTTKTSLEGESAKAAELDTTITSLQSDLQASREQESAARAELQSATTVAAEFEAKLRASETTSSTKMSELRAQLDDAQNRAAAAEDQLRSNQHDLGDLLAKIAATEKQKAEASSLAEEEINKYQAQVDILRSQEETTQAKLSSLQAEYDTLLENLSASEEALAKLGDDHERKMQSLRNGHEEAGRQTEARITELEGQVSSKSAEIIAQLAARDTLQKQLDEAVVSADKSSQSLAGMKSRMDKMEKELEIASAQLTAAITAANQQSGISDKLQAELDDISGEAKRSASLHKLSQDEVKFLSSRLEELQGQLVAAQSAADKASKATKAQHLEVARLIAENDVLKASIASSSSAPNAELEERIKELEASLTLKNQEVDEADDRVRDMYKTNAKLEKKVAKLQRQLASASTMSETAANTMANKTIPSIMAPPPVPTSKLSASAVPPSPARQPLRTVNIFDTAQTPVAGTKRHREATSDEKPLPAECVLLPPSEKMMPLPPPTSAKKPAANRTSFTPQRGGFNVFAAAPKSTPRNIFATPSQPSPLP